MTRITLFKFVAEVGLDIRPYVAVVLANCKKHYLKKDFRTWTKPIFANGWTTRHLRNVYKNRHIFKQAPHQRTKSDFHRWQSYATHLWKKFHHKIKIKTLAPISRHCAHRRCCHCCHQGPTAPDAGDGGYTPPEAAGTVLVALSLRLPQFAAARHRHHSPWLLSSPPPQPRSSNFCWWQRRILASWYRRRQIRGRCHNRLFPPSLHPASAAFTPSSHAPPPLRCQALHAHRGATRQRLLLWSYQYH